MQYLILEKVLFQSNSDFDICSQLLATTKTEAWVNCPRRMWKDYIDMKEMLYNQKDVSYTLNGINWGLGCNSIHFLDHLSWLTNSKLISIDNSGLDDKLFKAKRSGFIEFSGTLNAVFQNGNTLSLASERGVGNPSFIIEITCKDFSFIIEESSSKYTFQNLSHKAMVSNKEKKMTIPFQSQLTQLVAESLLSKGEQYLTPYEESTHQH